jgi:hypothetical protein
MNPTRVTESQVGVRVNMNQINLRSMPRDEFPPKIECFMMMYKKSSRHTTRSL